MKKILLAGVIVVSTFSGLVYAQNDPAKTAKTETPEIKAEIETLIAKAEASQKDPLKLNNAIQDLLNYRVYKSASTQATKSNVTVRLVKIYNSIDDTLTNTANKRRIIEFIGLRNNVPEARAFLIAVLESGKELYRTEALGIIYFGGNPGDDIYDKVKDLVARDIIKEESSLGALKGANPQRALPEIQKFVSTTKSPDGYIGAGQLLSFYRDPELLDVLVDRYGYFKSIPSSERPKNYAPQFAFSMEMLKKYIEVKEGSKLEKALEIFDDRGVFGDRKLPLLQKKLESNDSVTRKAAVRFLIRQAEIGSVSKEKISPVLKNAEARETDKDLKLKLKSVLKKIEPPTGGKK